MEKLSEENYYKILGVDKTASETEINKAYKKLAVKYHPDKNPDNKELAEENFKKVSEAYEVLSNQEKRQTYDQFGKSGLEQGGMGGGGFSRGQAEEIFSQFFGGQDPFSVLFGESGGAGMGGPGVQFRFSTSGMPRGMGGGMGGMHGGMPGGMPDIMAQMLGGMNGMGGMDGMGGGGRQGGGNARRRKSEQSHVLPCGTHVLVRGLQGAPQHNGKLGKVNDFDEQSGRYIVELADGDVLRIKHENLLQQLQAEVIGMQSKPEYNGQSVHVTDFDEDKGRYHVKVKGDLAALQPQNLILPDGTRARIVGLTSQPQWNQRVGKVLTFDRSKRRYLVQVSDEQQLSVKLENLLL
eukprot:CAMPEP_0119310288 /NCGR_PEP_ID=MMETSP1333-20130426/18585_1 /TAXON_ID=418940 /ORGANISM="Scyphosphaera apsteinii, Strain RCC1455" /LENGTH=350 /DNA_ID=CAMNT_0007314445 /DNA_START=18 /DNA_END=1070 /DNA_ORIENTATION=+